MSLSSTELTALRAFVNGLNELTRTTGISLAPTTGLLTYNTAVLATLVLNSDLTTYDVTNTADS